MSYLFKCDVCGEDLAGRPLRVGFGIAHGEHMLRYDCGKQIVTEMLKLKLGAGRHQSSLSGELSR